MSETRRISKNPKNGNVFLSRQEEFVRSR